MRKLHTYILFISLFWMGSVHAGIERYTSRIEGTDMVANHVEELYEDKHFEMNTNPFWGALFTNKVVSNYVQLGINPDVVQANINNGEVNVLLTYETWNSTTNSFDVNTTTVKLLLNHDGTAGYASANDLSTYSFNSAHRIQVKVLSIVGLNPLDIYLESSIEVERYYNFEFPVVSNLSDASVGVYNSEIEFRWDHHPGAESYELEWVHVNNYAPSQGQNLSQNALDYNFYLNSTRIETGNNFYRIPKIFSDGYIVYRIRPIGRKAPSFEQRVEGIWSAPESGIIGTFDPNNVVPTFAYSPTMNWSHQVAYAEDGKRFEGISFSDGLGRNRQSVARNSETGDVIVSNVYFDRLGRPTVSDLPTPMKDETMHHFVNFNLPEVPGVATQPVSYMWEYFDVPGYDPCAVGSPQTTGLSNSSGAGKYYSQNNQNADGANANIPDAENYPFTRVLYEDDLTGRVNSVGAAGSTLTTHAGKETSYHYVTPTQTELDEHFGVEVGKASHYQKMITVDPNGQVYTQFFDLAGRPIISYMEGPNPSNLLAIEGNLSGIKTKSILTDTENEDQLKIINETPPYSEITYSTYISSDGDYDFFYGFTPTQLQSACNPNTVCFDCVYDLEFIITSDCGDIETHSTNNINGDVLYGICNGAPFDFQTTISLTKGEYTVYKKLSVNQKAIDDYWCTYINNDSCIEAITETFDDLYEEEEFTKCQPIYDFSNGSSFCSGFRNMMLSDMTPGGQYASYTISNGTYSSSDPYSIFNPANSFNFGTPWNGSNVTYLDENGIDITQTVINNTTYGTDYNAKLKYFILHFRKEWSEELLPNHPEYCALQFCEGNSDSHLYDDQMKAINDFSTAYNSGFLKPLGFINPSGFGGSSDVTFLPELFPSPQTQLLDPLFVYTASNFPNPNPTPQTYVVDMFNDMTTVLNNYITIPDANSPTGSISLSLWEYSVWLQVKDNYSSAYSFFNENTRFDPSCHLDLIWLTFRNLYQEEKRRIFYEAIIDYKNANCQISVCIAANPPCVAPTVGAGLEDYSPRWMNPDIFNDYIANINGGAGASANLTAQATSTCLDIAEDYVDDWLDELSGCNMASLSPQQTLALRDELIDFCSLGCNSLHISGATTAPPGVSTQNNFTSIQQILNFYFGSATPLCNEFLISSPGPYISNDEISDLFFTTLDVCACDVLYEQKDIFDAMDPLELASMGINNLEQWLVVNLEVNLEDVDILLCSCDNYHNADGSYSDANGTYTDNLPAPHDVTIPIDLSCESESDCINCTEIGTASATLDALFVNSLLTAELFHDHNAYPLIAQNFFNREFGFDYDYQTYLGFINSCNGTSLEPVCSVNPILDKWLEMMNVNILRGKFKDGVSNLNLLEENIVYAYSGLKNSGLHKLYSTSVSGSTLTSTFSDGTSSCNFTYTLPTAADFDFEDIVRFGTVFPTSNCTTANTNFDLEVEYYNCGVLQTAYLSCVSSCFEVNICSCASTDQLCKAPLNYISNTDENCYQPQLDILIQQAFEAYEQKIHDQYDLFVEEYNTTCTAAFDQENMSITGAFNEYQKTLFYYDQAGNLVKTVAPKGVDELNSAQVAQVALNKNAIVTSTNPISPASTLPNHDFETTYKYNAYNQLVSTENPDQIGATEYWYDRFGRIALSQNPVQKDDDQFAYSSYDAYGRPYEVGITATTVPLPDFENKDCDNLIRQWVLTGVRTEVTITKYDKPHSLTDQTKFEAGIQQNLRLRVASMFYYPTLSNGQSGLAGYETATHYSYDPHGNVIEQLQDIPMLAPVEQDIKSTQYEFELISGNVKEVHYQKDKADQITHSYEYDALNRLTEVFTSADEVHKTRQAHYRYYDYGPLARIELGKNKVQGLDYTYTINGWLKGMNSSFLNTAQDMGRDGANGYSTSNDQMHNLFAKDVVGFSLGYFDGDYKPISSTSQLEGYNYSTPPSTFFENNLTSLYNGNIRNYTSSIYGLSTTGAGYQYDQLNRLKSTQYYYHNSANPNDGFISTPEYFNSYNYDQNGNITNLVRKGYGNDIAMDDFSYNYPDNSTNNKPWNRLDYVSDAVSTPAVGGPNNTIYTEDIDQGMSAGNFGYDKLGQLMKDDSENIQNIQWRKGDKKMKKMTRGTAGNESELEFKYNPFGQRVLKIDKPTNNGSPLAQDQWKYTYYSYDANGQVMAVYDLDVSTSVNKATLKEQHLYGASRLGMVKKDLLLYDNATIAFTPSAITINLVGQTYYEINNYLGNVNAVVTDRRTMASPAPGASTWEAVVVSNADYYPFGMLMPDRHNSFGNADPYRYAYNGMELDNSVSGTGNSYTTEFRQYDPRLARWKSLDPLMHQFPWMSPYVAFDDNPVFYTDVYGLASEGIDPASPEWKETANLIVQITGESTVNGQMTAMGNIWTHELGGFVQNIEQVEFSYVQKQAGNYEEEKPISNTITTETNTKTSGAPVLVPLTPMTVVKGSGATSSGIIGPLVRTFGLTVGAILIPHAGYNPESQFDGQSDFSLDFDLDQVKKEEDPNKITVYRGVGSSTTEYSLALNGIAVPKALIPGYNSGNPHSNPNSHTGGNNYSFMTSWTTDMNFARTAALYKSNSGVILRLVIDKSEMTISPASTVPPFDIEGEVQLFGVRKANLVIPVKKDGFD